MDTTAVPGLPMAPVGGAGFAEVFAIPAEPSSASPVLSLPASIEEIVSAVVSSATASRALLAEPAEEADPAAIAEVSPELLGLVAPLCPPAPEPETSPAPAPAPSGGAPKRVSDFQLRSEDGPIPAVVSPVPASSEKNAASVEPLPAQPVKIVEERPNNKFLSTDDESDRDPVKVYGIGRAKSPADMPATSEPVTAQTAPVAAPVVAPVVAPAVAFVAATSAMPTPPAPVAPVATVEIPERREISLPITDATSVVREVAEMTHDFRLRERSSVEVTFNFKDETELSVRLAYRDGDVHTTFRTDSEELRAALGREWQSYAAQVAREPVSYRVADAVFTGANDRADSSSGRDFGSSAGDDARDRRQAFLPEPSGSRRFGFFAGSSRAHVPALGLRISSEHHLHAFA